MLMVDWCLFDFSLEYFSIFSFRLCQENYEFVLGVWNRKCGAFLSSLDRDPHPTCPRCRGKICTRDLTCDFCIDWSPAQWELFAKKHAYKDRKKSRPSGSVPPVPGAAPCAGTSSEVPQPGTSSSSSSCPSGGQDKMGGSQGAPGVVSREASSPPARPRSSERGRSVSGHSSVARLCLCSPFGSWRGGGCLVAADFPCPHRFLGCFSPLITARSAT